MTGNERLRELRKNGLGMTMAELAPFMGLKKSGVSEIESGRRKLSEMHIKLLTSEPIKGKHISEAWLRTGEGDMFLDPDPESEIREWIDRILTEEPDGLKARLVSALAKLDPEGWKALYELAVQFVGAADGLQDRPSGGQGPPADEDPIERDADILRESYIQTRRGKEASSGSSGGDGGAG